MTTTEEFAVPPPIIHVVAESCFNLAAWHNAVPVIRSIEVHNPSSRHLEALTLEMTASPPFANSATWNVTSLGPGEQIEFQSANGLDVSINLDFLEQLDEAVRGVLCFRLFQGDQLLAEKSCLLRVLARDQWGGMSDMAGLLPAFVTPNDPALTRLMRSAAQALERDGHDPTLEGYQTGDPRRVYVQAAALWSAVAAESIVYANPPRSFERTGQKVRRIETIVDDKLATCLDSALLFASGLEAIGLHPIVVMLDGHAFAGVWLVERTLNSVVDRDCSELRKAVVGGELVVFETTLANRPARSFEQAVAAANTRIAENREHQFLGAIDVARARSVHILPLASFGQRRGAQGPAMEPQHLTIPQPPTVAPVGKLELDLAPRTPADRIERWQRRLLDLSLRNRLLNFRPTKQTIPLVCSELFLVEDKLASGKRLRLLSFIKEQIVVDRDQELLFQRTLQDPNLEFAKQALERDELVSSLDQDELGTRSTHLFRRVKNDLSEGGANTLYLALGFLRWKQDPKDSRSYRAPLLLVPIMLTRRSTTAPFYIARHDDDVRFNATLLQMLKKDFGCDLTALESDLPTDDHGIDVSAILELTRRAVRDVPGFEVVEEAAISTFSFAKYLMWKDLVDRLDQLARNRVVRHLVHEPDKPFASPSDCPIPQPEELDARFAPADLVHPLPADSSQLASVIAAAAGRDFVLIGPPGTGKSQTIANLIAQCLSVGKTVLFVAEKTAALDVVYRRLRQYGLGDCCVELHSNKAERRQFLEQLEASWKRQTVAVDTSEWIEISERLRVRRDELNQYVAALHTTHPNGWTVYRAMGLAASEHMTPAPNLGWPARLSYDDRDYRSLRACVEELAAVYQRLPAEADLGRFHATDWSMAWERELLETCSDLKQAGESVIRNLDDLLSRVDPALPVECTESQFKLYFELARELARIAWPIPALVKRTGLDELQRLLNRRDEMCRICEHAQREYAELVCTLAKAVGTDSQEFDDPALRHGLEQLARVMVSVELPPPDLVGIHDLDALRHLVAKHHQLLKDREMAEQALTARNYHSALLNTIQIENIETAWSAASRSWWPWSALRKRQVRTALNACIKSRAGAVPEIDIPLFRSYFDCRAAIEANQTALALSDSSQKMLERGESRFHHMVDNAEKLRSALEAAGGDPRHVAMAQTSSLQPLADTAQRLLSVKAEIEKLETQLHDNLTQMQLPLELLQQTEWDTEALRASIDTARRWQEIGARLGLKQSELGRVVEADADEVRQVARKYCQSAKHFREVWGRYVELAKSTPAQTGAVGLIQNSIAQAERVIQNRSILKQWTMRNGVRHKAHAQSLNAVVDALDRQEFTAAQSVARFDLAYIRWWLPLAVDHSDTLRLFQSYRHEDAIKDFQHLDNLARKASVSRALQGIHCGLPSGEYVAKKSELGLLRHQLGLKRPSRSIREIIGSLPQHFRKLAPCLLMSPLSIAQYLPASQEQYDVVVFDEASQITTWDAIGAIARGKQTIVVGDPKQLPPTNFFVKADADDEHVELEDHEQDLESILDEVRSAGLPTIELKWHYRSRHESLIAFSNYYYYGNHLITFPAAEFQDKGVSLQVIKAAVYDRGKSRTNRKEAEAIVADVLARMKSCLSKPENQRLTYGVVTFNSQQQTLIQDLIDQALREHPELEWFFSDERIEPTVVKNLENVQGDERDVMYFSITFGKDATGKFPIDFGAINRDGGERRLNVAITRARQALWVYASFMPDELHAERSTKRGVHDLKAFLEFAHQGPTALIPRLDRSQGGFDSLLEKTLADALSSRGWRIESQVGVSGFRVDLGIVHPDCTGTFLAGVECDGTTYQRSATARDRDKTRQDVLESLGWKMLRVWSPDWWYDPDSVLNSLHHRLEQLLMESRIKNGDEGRLP